jgi:hypothetical protein
MIKRQPELDKDFVSVKSYLDLRDALKAIVAHCDREAPRSFTEIKKLALEALGLS